MSSHRRVLVHRVGKRDQQHYLVSQEPTVTTLLVQSTTSVIQGYTQPGGVPSLGGFSFFLVGMMRDDHIYFSHIHLGLTLPGKSHQWERTM